MRTESIQTDITVIGGGLSGVNAAIAAARLGRTVALIQNRPVLGGNSSSEVRVWVCGATAHGTHRYARETGIMGELFVENQFQNPDGNPYFWDLVVLEAVRAEPNIQLFLNTDVHEVEASGSKDDRRIEAVTGWMMGSERRIRFESEMFLDCTGDGLVGFLAGAEYRLGREARNEYNEEWAPEIADDITLGSSILFYSKDVGHPVKYVPPSFAKDITQTSIPIKRVIRSGDNGCSYWWIEWGGELDTVHQNERIRDELWSVIYGIWNYIKNSGDFEAQNMTLEWVGALPGKREYRRFVGDYVLNQNDIIAQREFEDRVAFGGWSIDLHPPQGMYSTESGSKHMHMDGSYHIPFRSLYSINVSNLLFAGRNISASHVAFGTTRVMATCAVIGEAAGTGAALAVQHGTTPRGVYQRHLAELHQTLLRQDASVLGLAGADASDLARTAASVTASSTRQMLSVEEPAEAYPLDHDAGLLMPVSSALEKLELLIDAAVDGTLEVEVWSTGRAENYVPHTLQVSGTVEVSAGENQWVSVALDWKPEKSQNTFIVIKANPAISLYLSKAPLSGVLGFQRGADARTVKELEDHHHDQPVVLWSMRKLVRKPFCFRAFPQTTAFAVENVVDGYLRPYGGPHLWMSEPLAAGSEAWVELTWQDTVAVGEVHLTFNDDVNEDLINLHHHRTEFEVIPELVRDYRIEAWMDGDQAWSVLHRETNNHKRKRVHRLNNAVQVSRLRVVAEATNGSPSAELIEIRVYS
ncbi:FAD-dependent oxidoreductase [Paenibacillus radicis (ex Xue et al. 2023)]|uniref:FAD-dependent oxidoreductase n=1 Tax=Paenibacillus radicis (ex Xue et al. 2023) TaxID=2972489 RepID=A0ABT1YEK4_9BACL|nr:FAD-dependent oxidoreductase [Paenibacillus radicis (ex Xue et al. 2023)]MCR8631627.1 FAD-dependent oxidoreductase [Paenibacillus radicis (ex Xue et al. 2023)]